MGPNYVCSAAPGPKNTFEVGSIRPIFREAGALINRAKDIS